VLFYLIRMEQLIPIQCRLTVYPCNMIAMRCTAVAVGTVLF
jgi:hypothetical protein